MKNFALLLTALLPTVGFAADETEPPLGISLKLDGKEFHLEAGKEAPVEGDFSNPKATVTLDPVRHFERDGVSFDYPAYFSFQFSPQKNGARVWTLKGTRAVCIVRISAAKMASGTYAAILLREYGDRATSEPVTHLLHGVEFQGTRIILSVAKETPIIQDVISLPIASGSCILVLQDHQTDGKSSDDEQKWEKLLDSTLKY